MLNDIFRPWGELEWVLSKIPQKKWDLISCVSTEDRFIGTVEYLKKNNILKESLFFKIEDPKSHYTEEIINRTDKNIKKYEQLIGNTKEIEDHFLLEPYYKIVESVENFLKKTDGDLILDISCLPKRFFFPILKLIIGANLKNLLITYSKASSYCNVELSANPDSWSHLPLFLPESKPEDRIDLAIISVGFMPFGLPKLLGEKFNSIPIKLLFPFPPGPPNYQRTWEFVRKIEKDFTFKSSDHIIRIDSLNMPEAYNIILKETAQGLKKTIFAPYGPKSLSIAMCIFATKFQTPVYYTQPSTYHPEYSDGLSETYAYCISLDSKNLY